ncbi:restriction endonuclease subunit S [Streptomyces sp. NPDC088757]|uniref:restriction endonuclease subunit S n=1 Tax=Streptomyces sp. NPDC088757 TaxID=3365889 RepID=UPI0037FF72BD
MTGTAVKVGNGGGGDGASSVTEGKLGLPDGWAIATIGELCDVNPRGFDEEPNDDDLISQVPMASVEAETGRMDPSALVRYGDFKKKSLTRFQESDVLFAKITPCMENGKIVQAKELTGGRGLGSTEFHVLRSRGGLLPEYLTHYLLQRSVRKAAEPHMSGAVGQRRVPRLYLEGLQIPVPPLAEQRRIVARLDEQLAHVETGESSLKRAANKLTELINQIRSREVRTSPDKELPPGWRWGTVGDVLQRIEAGKSFTCLPRSAHEDEWGIIKVSAMTWGEFRAEENKAVPEGREVNPDFEICSGDILLSRANTVEYVGAPVLVGPVRGKLLLSDKSLRLVPKDRVSREWLLEVLSSRYVRDQYSDAATGTSDSMRNISQGVVKSARIPVPGSYDEQQRIASVIRDRIAQVGVLRDALDSQAAEVINLRTALLHAAFTGTLVAQDPTDEPASALLDRIRAQRSAATGTKSARRRTPRTSKSTGDPGQGELPL